MKVYYLFTAVLAFASTAVFAGQYKSCDFRAGSKNSCSMPYSGQAVTLDHGQYKTCEFRAGNKNTCSMPYSGQAVIPD